MSEGRVTGRAVAVSTSERGAESPVRWVPVAGLSELARALLGERAGGREVIPAHVADRVTTLADQWAAHGFTAESVRPWTELQPATAAALAGRGITPDALGRHTVTAGATRTTLWQALISGALSAAEALDRMEAAGTPKRSGESSKRSPERSPESSSAAESPVSSAQPSAVPAVPAPAVFSHPHPESGQDGTNRERRPMPPQTPFRT